MKGKRFKGLRMIRLKSILILVIGVFSFATVAAQEQQADCEGGVDYSNRGSNLINSRDYEGAIQALNCAIQLNPQNAFGYLFRGVAYFYMRDYDDALVDLTEADTLAPNTSLTQYYFGAVYGARGDHKLAISYLDKAIDQQSDYLDAYAYRGVEYTTVGKYDTAILDFNRALEIKSDYAYAYFYRATAYANLRQYDKAVADFDHAIELEPTYKDATVSLGRLPVKASDYGRFVSRIRTVDLALQYMPLNSELYWERGTMHYEIGEHDEAITDLTHAIELNPTDARAYYFRGTSYLLSRNIDASLADFGRVIDINPNLFYVYLTRGNIYRGEKDFARAIDDYTHFIELIPHKSNFIFTDVTALYNIGYLYRGYTYSLNGDNTEAAADFFRYASREGTQNVEAGELSVGQVSTIEMSEGKVFQFKFDAVAGQHLKLSAVSAHRYVTVDTVIVILGPDGKPLDANGNNSETDLAAIVKDFEVPEDGRYTLIVTHADGIHEGDVKVLIEVIASQQP
jgi:tetratricopeptide (TPR) repeat protein